LTANQAPLVAAIGIPVVDMVGYLEDFPARGGHSPGTALQIAPGGPLINVATGVSRLGHASTLLGKVGKDPLGKLVHEALASDGVVIPDRMLSEHPTGLVLVLFDNGGAGEMRSFSFREGSADTTLGPADIEPELLKGVKALFLDGLLCFDERLTRAGQKAADLAKGQGARVFCDPNLRIPEDELASALRERLDLLIGLSDEVLLNEREARILVRKGTNCGVEQLGALLKDTYASVRRWVIKQGEKGCYILSANQSFAYPAFHVEVSDTSGAGDSFDAGWIVGFLEGMDDNKMARFASASAALTVSGKGAWCSLPDRKRVCSFLEDRQ